ncbi:MAG: class I tRNA ligase family protein, partial [Candidatus Cloacimonetes bacterium]|nr:class I tRNA ligase family protein [Candidatus Cloacimonadota bacterium]
YVLLDVMQAGMRLLHPIMPFISEEIWQEIKTRFPMQDEALIIAKFPISDPEMIDSGINDEMKLMQESITAIRNLRKQLNLSPATPIGIVARTADDTQNTMFEDYARYFTRLAKVDSITSGNNVDKPKPAVSAVVRNLEIFIPLAGLIDPEQEKARLSKQLEKLQKELDGISRKLGNQNFIQNAKPEVVEKEKEKHLEIQTKVDLIQAQLSDL